MKIKNKNSGFTLIELLVVISIIGLLASVVLVALNGARQKSRDAKRIADMNQLAKTMELFYSDTLTYPTGTGTAGSGTNYVCSGAAGCGGRVFGLYQLVSYNTGGTAQYYLTPTYMKFIPSAPTPQDGSCNATNNQYYYESNSLGNTYTFTFCVGGTTGNLTPGVHYLTPGGLK